MIVENASVAERDIIAERRRQKSEEGWTLLHDDQHTNFEMSAAAGAYAIAAALGDESRKSISPPFSLRNNQLLDRIWPWDFKWWKPKDRRRDLVRAGALIIAEIERLDRIEARKEQEQWAAAARRRLFRDAQ